MKTSAALQVVSDLRPMDPAAHRRLYLPVVRVLPNASTREPVHVDDVALYKPAGKSRSRGGSRATTIAWKRVSKRDLVSGARAYPKSITEAFEAERPVTRADCLPGGKNEQRPCPWVNCIHHLALEVEEETGSIKIPRPDRETWGTPRTCALDVADEGTHTLEEVGELLNVTRERMRQLEMKALKKVRAEFVREGLGVEELDAVVARMEKW